MHEGVVLMKQGNIFNSYLCYFPHINEVPCSISIFPRASSERTFHDVPIFNVSLRMEIRYFPVGDFARALMTGTIRYPISISRVCQCRFARLLGPDSTNFFSWWCWARDYKPFLSMSRCSTHNLCSEMT